MEFSKQEYKELSSEILFAKYQKGDVYSFDVLLERHKRLIYSLILRYVKQKSVVDELFQVIFMKVCKNKDQFREAVSFKSWLATICRNTCIDYLRKQNRSLKTQSLDDRYDEDSRSLAETVADEGPTPDEVMQIDMEDQRLKSLLNELPEEQRSTFYMKIVMELTFEEIGQSMNCSANTAKSRYRYAVSTLQSLVKRERFLDKNKAVS